MCSVPVFLKAEFREVRHTKTRLDSQWDPDDKGTHMAGEEV